MVGGNITAKILKREPGEPDARGIRTPGWAVASTLHGYLDMITGDSNYNRSAKVRESTHVFLTAYRKINLTERETRAEIDGSVYDVTMIDDPMGMHAHLEIYLKYIEAAK